jgi:chemotaxis signal transduction protein
VREVAAVEVECDVLFFTVGGRTYGTDPRDVVRVDRLRPGLHSAPIVPGAPCSRGLVVSAGDHEVEVPVDTVAGVRRTSRSQLRPVPPYLLAQHPNLARELLGLLMVEGSSPILVLDLKRVSERATPPEARTVTSHGKDYRFG